MSSIDESAMFVLNFPRAYNSAVLSWRNVYVVYQSYSG